MARYEVEIAHGPYTGRIQVHAEDSEEAKTKALRIARRRHWLTLPLAYEHVRVREVSDG